VADLRYPIGRFEWSAPENEAQMAERRVHYIDALEKLPANLRAAVEGLNAEKLDTPYRPEGWTVRQVVHHVPDSHLNAYVRFKLAMTEAEPTIKTYHEDLWAKLPDTEHTPVETSLHLLQALHERWVTLLRAITPEDFARTLRHPELGVMSLDRMLAMYAWHSAHHTAHIINLRKRMGWK